MTDEPKELRFPAVKLRGQVFVATRTPEMAAKRLYPRHSDAMTTAILTVARSSLDDGAANRLIRAIDNGKEKFEMGTAFADGSEFISDIQL